MAKKFSHLNELGQANMVDVSDKPISAREAVAVAEIHMQPDTLAALKGGSLPKGDVLATARIAGIQAAKQTHLLIPLCHPLPISKVKIDFEMKKDLIRITATTRTTAQTGVEMESLTAASVAALTLFDMCKSADKTMFISGIEVLKKTGGKSDAKHH